MKLTLDLKAVQGIENALESGGQSQKLDMLDHLSKLYEQQASCKDEKAAELLNRLYKKFLVNK